MAEQLLPVPQVDALALQPESEPQAVAELHVSDGHLYAEQSTEARAFPQAWAVPRLAAWPREQPQVQRAWFLLAAVLPDAVEPLA